LENHIPKGRKITQEEWGNLSAEKNSENLFMDYKNIWLTA
jgi:hypothetical protein